MKESELKSRIETIITQLEDVKDFLEVDQGEAFDDLSIASDDLSLLVQKAWPIEKG